MNTVKKKHVPGRFLLVVFSLGLSLFLAELVLRHFIAMDSGSEYRIPHPVLGWVLEPNASYVNRMGEDRVRVTYNSGGFRDVEHNVQNAHHVFRILVLGDSFMEAYSVELNDAFHRLVDGLVRGMGIDVEVINLGVGGYGTLQEYLVFGEVGKMFAPDLVLLGFYIANDVRNNSFELESMVHRGSMKVESRPFLDPGTPEEWRIKRVDFEGARQRYEAEKARRSTFLWKIKNQSVVMQLMARVTGRKTVSGKQGNVLGEYGAGYCMEPPEYTRAWDITKSILARLKRDVEATGSRLVVFSVPALQDTSAPYMEQIKRRVPNSDPLCFEEAPAYARLKHLLDGLGIDFIDLLPEFRNYVREGKTLFRESDRHWNPEAHMLAAEAVVSSLVEKKILFPRLHGTDISTN